MESSRDGRCYGVPRRGQRHYSVWRRTYNYDKQRQMEIDLSIEEFSEKEAKKYVGMRGKEAMNQLSSFVFDVHYDLNTMTKDDFCLKYSNPTHNSSAKDDAEFLYEYGVDAPTIQSALKIITTFYDIVNDLFYAFERRQSNQPSFEELPWSFILLKELSIDTADDALPVVEYIMENYSTKE